MTYKARIELNKYLNSYFNDLGNSNFSALEAGCGSASRITIPTSYHITGIDISQSQLDRNKSLNKKILGSLETHEFESESYDLIVCWDVLEHLQHPDKVLHRSGGIRRRYEYPKQNQYPSQTSQPFP